MQSGPWGSPAVGNQVKCGYSRLGGGCDPLDALSLWIVYIHVHGGECCHWFLIDRGWSFPVYLYAPISREVGISVPVEERYLPFSQYPGGLRGSRTANSIGRQPQLYSLLSM